MLINSKEKTSNFPHELCNQCPTCGELFNSTKSFDYHRTGTYGVNRRCLTAQEMQDKGMAKNRKEFWITAPWDEEVINRIGNL